MPRRGLASSLGPWQLSGLMAQATGTRVVGTGLSAGTVALLDDRALMPGNAIAQVIFAGGVLLALARFGGEVAFAQPSAVLLVAYLAATLASGAHGVRLGLREGRLAPTPVRGGIPVQLRASTTTATVQPTPTPASNGHAHTRRAPTASPTTSTSRSTITTNGLTPTIFNPPRTTKADTTCTHNPSTPPQRPRPASSRRLAQRDDGATASRCHGGLRRPRRTKRP